MKTLLLMVLLALPANAMSPQEFQDKVSNLWAEENSESISGRWITTINYYSYFTSIVKSKTEIVARLNRGDLKYQLIHCGGEVIIAKEWLKLPITLWKTPNKALLKVIGEESS